MARIWQGAHEMLKVDFHAHTADDPCDRIPYSAAELVERAAQVGLDALAITLHDSQYDGGHLADFARQRGVTLIPGIERTILGRHVLLINFPAKVVGVSSFEELAELKTHHRQGLVIAPHPFFPLTHSLRGLTDRHRELFDAVEYNGCYTSLLNFNRAAVRWASGRKKPVVGCSDAHRLEMVGMTCSLVDAVQPTADDICAAVKEDRVQVSTRPLSAIAAASYLAKITLSGRRHAQVGPDTSPAAAST